MEQQFGQQVAGDIANYLLQELHIDPRLNHYRVVYAVSGPRILTLGLAINPRYTPKVSRMSDQLSQAARLDRSAGIRISRGSRGTLALEIPKPEGLWYDIGIEALPPCRRLKTPIGIDGEHRPARVNFGNPLTPHLLAAGTTGSGKTNTARLFIYNLARGNDPQDLRLVLVDTRKHGLDWRPFSNLPHLAHPLVTDDADALRVLSWAVAEMDRRAMDGRTHPRIFLAIEEAQALLDRDEYVTPIGDIAAVGRAFGIHLLLITQNPTAEMLGSTNIKRNMTTRLVGKVDSAQAAVIAAGIKETGAELLTGPGDQLLVQPSGVQRITAALVRDRDLNDLPRSEWIESLDLSEYEDPDHVREQADPRTAPIEPAQVALAMVSDRGINWLANQLHIGNKRATRVLAFSDKVREAIEGLGYTIIPHPQRVPAGSVTLQAGSDGG